MRRPARGFTLLELLVAIALMAVLAVLCWRGLDSVLRSRDRIGAASDELRALTAAFTQMDEDLRRSWATRLLNVPGRVPIRFAVPTQGGPVVMELMRETGSREERLRLQRVLYRLRGGLLERAFGPIEPFAPRAADASPGKEASALVQDDPALVWQPLLADVTGFDIRVWIESQRRWISAASSISLATGAAGALSGGTPAPGGDAGPPSAAPAGGVAAQDALAITGVEVAVLRRDGGRILRVFTVKD